MNYNSILRGNRVRNYEGALAYQLSPELELYSAVVTASLSNLFYEKQDDRVDRISTLVGKVAPEFVAQLAVYARNVMNLRSIPLLLVVELAKVHSGDNLISRTVPKVVQRADEIMELLMCYQWRNPNYRPSAKKLGSLSSQIKKGLQIAFNHFDEYQFAKYNRSNLEVKLRDALFLIHPKAKDEKQQAIFDKIASDTLDVPYTWEVEFSALGQEKFASEQLKRQAFARKWEELIRSEKVGYMALMRNLRNMLEAQVSHTDIKMVCNRLASPAQVAKSKQLPFRYLSAYREMEGINSLSTKAVMQALESAVMVSASNIKGFDENTRVLLASDVSGSMYSSISPRSTVHLYDVGLLLSMLFRNTCDQVIAGIFGDRWEVVNLPNNNVLAATQKLYNMEGEVGYSTNGYKVIDWLIKEHKVMDKVMMFTDLQMWDSSGRNKEFETSWKQYKKIAPEAKLYLFDLAGYGQAPLRVESHDVFLIAGWSDRIFDVLAALEKGNDALDVIKSVEI